MTEGSISQKIIFFAIPLFLGNLFQQLYNTADSLIVGVTPAMPTGCSMNIMMKAMPNRTFDVGSGYDEDIISCGYGL